jgi:hypothetical protein
MTTAPPIGTAPTVGTAPPVGTTRSATPSPFVSMATASSRPSPVVSTGTAGVGVGMGAGCGVAPMSGGGRTGRAPSLAERPIVDGRAGWEGREAEVDEWRNEHPLSTEATAASGLGRCGRGWAPAARCLLLFAQQQKTTPHATRPRSTIPTTEPALVESFCCWCEPSLAFVALRGPQSSQSSPYEHLQ